METKNGIEANRNEPQSVANEELTKLTQHYPKTHPFYSETTDESLATLDKITLEDIKSFYNTFYGGTNSISSFVNPLLMAF